MYVFTLGVKQTYAHTGYFLKLAVHVKLFFILKSIFILNLNSQQATLQSIQDKKGKSNNVQKVLWNANYKLLTYKINILLTSLQYS